MTEEITNLIVEIRMYIGFITAYKSIYQNPDLFREYRIKSIYSSLAIEQNTLSLDQVTDVIDGKRVLGPPKDNREVKNAYEAYENVSDMDPCDLASLLYAHRLMMKGLVKEAGQFRSRNVGVFYGDRLIHAGTPVKYVPELMNQLMTWLKKSGYHPLVKSCIFHYEFEFIHPFADGNGRTGRLWQSLILQKWNDIFAWLPVATLVHENKAGYYKALLKADNAGDSTEFVEFMLGLIRDALKELSENQKDSGNRSIPESVVTNVAANEDRILCLLKDNGKLTAGQIAETIGLSQRHVQRILAKLKAGQRIIRHGASKNGYWEVKE